MNLKERLFIENTKKYWVELSYYVIENNLFEELFDLFLNSDVRTIQRASAIFMTLVDIKIDLFTPKTEILIQKLNEKPNNTQKRNIFRVLQFLKIPEEQESKILNHCVDCLSDYTQSIAVRAFSMQVFYNLTLKYPELKNELSLLIQENIKRNPSAAISGRGNKLLKKLK